MAADDMGVHVGRGDRDDSWRIRTHTGSLHGILECRICGEVMEEDEHTRINSAFLLSQIGHHDLSV